ncbi:MAG TPA: glycoside hydrolase family 2, partial [Clostridiales bacterium]|nr:glycoside hydrolase family 2 [Clostridiales bacterium]
MAELKTIWFDKIDRSKPLCEYPRPQLKRDCWQCLNGEYEYSVTEEKAKDMGEGDGIIIVPFAVECSLSGVERTITRNQRLWYRKIFTLDSSLSDKNIILHFGAVDWQCRVFINNMTVGSHVG